MKSYTRIALGLAFAALWHAPVNAQKDAKNPVTSRTDLQRNDLSIPGWESLQTRVDFPPKVTAPWHKHPGEEIIFVLSGHLEYRIEGKPPVTLTTGGVLFIPPGIRHSARNVGPEPASELATYIVQKGKPLVEIVDPPQQAKDHCPPTNS